MNLAYQHNSMVALTAMFIVQQSTTTISSTNPFLDKVGIITKNEWLCPCNKTVLTYHDPQIPRGLIFELSLSLTYQRNFVVAPKQRKLPREPRLSAQFHGRTVVHVHRSTVNSDNQLNKPSPR